MTGNFKQVREMYGEGLSAREIAQDLGISTRYVRHCLAAIGQGFASPGEYMADKAKQRINPKTGTFFTSISQYSRYRTGQRIDYILRGSNQHGDGLARGRGYRDLTHQKEILAVLKIREPGLGCDTLPSSDIESLASDGLLKTPRDYLHSHDCSRIDSLFLFIEGLYSSGKLSKTEHRVISLRYREGRSLRSAAKFIGSSHEKVRQTEKRALGKLTFEIIK